MAPEKLKIVNRTLYGVDAIIFNNSGKVLMLHRKVPSEKYVTGWEFVKGALRERETFINAALREIEEETGLQVDYIGVIPNTFHVDARYRKKEQYDFVIKKAYVFETANENTDKINLDPNEHDSFQWMTIQDAIKYNWVENGEEILKTAYKIIKKEYSPTIKLCPGLQGCKNAEGVAIIIDVFRATSTICCILSSKPKSFLLARDLVEFHNLNQPNAISFSEINNDKTKFDNSPIKALSLKPKEEKILLISRNGTTAFAMVKHCDNVFAASLLNLSVIADYIVKKQFPVISIIPIGNINRNEITSEDILCANLLKNKILNEKNDFNLVNRILLELRHERKNDLDAPQGYNVEVDLALCSSLDILEVIPKIRYDNNLMEVIDVYDEK